MQNKKINEIRKLAREIDVKINLFEGFVPKKIDGYKGELLFWRQVVNIYGIFSDCDRVQIKGKKNLIDLMKRYSLIERNDYDFVYSFWNDISELRKWFCHNNDESLYYQKLKLKRISSYLKQVFLISTDKPNSVESVQIKDWDLLTSDLERRFSEYLDILLKGLNTWKSSNEKGNLINEWNDIFAKALFEDKELIRNVLADISEYEKRNQNINMPVASLAQSYEKKLADNGKYFETNIKDILCKMTTKKSNKEIVYESIRNTGII